MKKVIVSWSSGKDSCLSLIRLLQDPNYEVVGVFTSFVDEQVPYQVTPISVVEMQAQLMGLPLIKIELPEVFPSNAIYQACIVNGLKSCELEFDCIAFGDMFHNGIADYRRRYIEPAGWQCVFPLLGEPSNQLAKDILDIGIKTILVTTQNEMLPAAFCGQWYTSSLLNQLPENVDWCGENGEFHTLVTQAPCFAGELQLSELKVEPLSDYSHLRYRAVIS